MTENICENKTVDSHICNVNDDDQPTIKLGIIGTRTYRNYDQLCEYIDNKFPPGSISTIVSGGASGADALAERYARDRKLEKIIHKPEWNKYPNKYIAARTRNTAIVRDSNHLIAFWDGISTGTKMTIDIARKANIPIDIFRYD